MFNEIRERKVLMRSITKVFFFCLLSLVSLAILPAVSQAAGPSWVTGYPKLVQKNALLVWVPTKGAAEYKVYRGEAKGKGAAVIATVKSTKYIDKDVPTGKTYYYSIAAVVAGAEGERSVEGAVSVAAEKVFVPVKVPKLVEPHILTLTGGKNAVGIRWEGMGGTDLVSISVYRSEAKGQDYAMIGSATGDMFEDKDVQQGKTYYYVVTAVDSQLNETKYSNEISAAIPKPAKVEAAAVKAAGKAPPTKMRSAKLLFRITDGKNKDFPLGNVQGVCVDEAVGHIYVSSWVYGGVLVYDMGGRFQFGIRKDGVSGTEKFKSPTGVAIGNGGNLYVSDFDSPNLEVFDMAGRHVDTINVDVSDIPRLKKKTARNYAIAISKDGKVYTTEAVSDAVYAYGLRGKRVLSIKGARGEKYRDYEGQVIFNGPGGIAISNDGDIVFVDTSYTRLMVFGDDGKFKRSISSYGTNAGELNAPAGVAIGKGGEILVADAATPNIQAFSTAGKFLYALCNEKVDGPPDVNDMRGIAVDSKERLYVSEGNMNRVSVFQLVEGITEISAEKIEKKK